MTKKWEPGPMTQFHMMAEEIGATEKRRIRREHSINFTCECCKYQVERESAERERS